jgi:hypothetical protein
LPGFVRRVLRYGACPGAGRGRGPTSPVRSSSATASSAFPTRAGAAAGRPAKPEISQVPTRSFPA